MTSQLWFLLSFAVLAMAGAVLSPGGDRARSTANADRSASRFRVWIRRHRTGGGSGPAASRGSARPAGRDPAAGDRGGPSATRSRDPGRQRRPGLRLSRRFRWRFQRGSSARRVEARTADAPGGGGQTAGLLWPSRAGSHGVVQPARIDWPRRLLIPVTVAAAGVLVVGVVMPRLGVLLGLGVAGWLTARQAAARRQRAEEHARLAAAAPAVVDLLGACLLAGLNGHLAVLKVAERAPPALAPDLHLAAVDLRLGRSPSAALRGAAERTGLDELRAAAGALEAAERWGAPAAEALGARAEALRSRLRLEAEAAAGRTSVRLSFPLVLCFLPAFVLLTVVPLIAGALRSAGF